MGLLGFVQRLPLGFLAQWSYVFVFLFTVIEGLPFIGLVVPGQTAVMVAAFFARLGVLKLWMVVLATVVGAFLGDILGYALGRRYGHAFIIAYGPKLFFDRKRYEYLRTVLHEHPGKALVLGRFNSLTRAFSPLVAGATELGLGVFLLYSGIAVLLWGTTYLAIGYVFGQGFELAAKYVGTFGLAALIAIVALALSYRRLQRFVERYQREILKYPVALLGAAAASLYLFGLLVDNVMDRELITKLDAYVAASMPAWRDAFLTGAMAFFTALLQPMVIIPLSALLFFVLLRMKRGRAAAVFAVSMTLGFLADTAFKVLVHRARPEGALLTVAGYSFPSGHAAMSTIFFGFLLWAYKDEIIGPARRWLFIAVMALLPFFVGLSRIYLGVHWTSDVLAGWALGVSALTLTLLGFLAAEYVEVEKRLRVLLRMERKAEKEREEKKG